MISAGSPWVSTMRAAVDTLSSVTGIKLLGHMAVPAVPHNADNDSLVHLRGFIAQHHPLPLTQSH
jgi:hypothetical protein